MNFALTDEQEMIVSTVRRPTSTSTRSRKSWACMQGHLQRGQGPGRYASGSQTRRRCSCRVVTASAISVPPFWPGFAEYGELRHAGTAGVVLVIATPI